MTRKISLACMSLICACTQIHESNGAFGKFLSATADVLDRNNVIALSTNEANLDDECGPTQTCIVGSSVLVIDFGTENEFWPGGTLQDTPRTVNGRVTTTGTAPIGAPCTSDISCASGFCADGVCCSSACSEGCGKCNLPDSLGICSPLEAGTDCGIAGSCALPGICDGISLACPGGFAPAGTVCRPSSGLCDVEETCSGVSARCPPDQFVAAGVVCRPLAGICDVAEVCTGSSADCPPDGFAPASTICNPSCNPPQTCSGSDATCPPCSCVRRTCAEQGFNCGLQSDGCGGTQDCGTCTGIATCGGGGRPGFCGFPSGNGKYFGYWPGSVSPPIELIAGQTDHCNVTMGVRFEYIESSGEMRGEAQAQAAERAGLKMIMFIVDPFNPHEHFDDQWVPAVRPHLANIVAFMVRDEPTGASETPYLEATMARFREAFGPSTPKMWINFTDGTVRDPTYRVPTGTDWCSFDCYGPWNNCWGSGRSVDQIYALLEQKCNSPTQRTLLLPQAYVGSGLTEPQVIALANQYLSFAQSNPRIIGLVPFSWADVSQLPNLLNAFRPIGVTFTGR